MYLQIPWLYFIFSIMYQIIKKEWWQAISCLWHSTSQFQKLMACLLNAPFKKFIHAQEFYISCFYVISSVNYIRQILSGDTLNILQNQRRIATLLAVKSVIAIGKLYSFRNIKYNVLLQRCNNKSFLDIMWKKYCCFEVSHDFWEIYMNWQWPNMNRYITMCFRMESHVWSWPMCMYKV